MPLRLRDTPRLPQRARWMGTLLFCALALASGAFWQWQARAAQHLDVGSGNDEGYFAVVHDREQSSATPDGTIRWTQAQTEARLWSPPIGSTAQLIIDIFSPQEQQTLEIRSGLARATMQLHYGLHRYAVVLPVASGADLELVFATTTSKFGDDPRQLGVALDRISIVTLGGPTPWSLLGELARPPLLPLALGLLMFTLALGGAARWLSLATTLGVALLLAVCAIWQPMVQLQLALACAVAVAILALTAIAFRLLPRTCLPRTDQSARRWIFVAWAVAIAAAYTPVVSSDGIGYYVYLRSLVIDGDLQFANDYAIPSFLRAPVIGSITPTGYEENPFAVGSAILWSPLFLIAHGLILVGRSFGLPWAADGAGTPYVAITLLGSALAGLATMLICYRICRRFVGAPAAALAAITLLTGTNLLYYAARDPSFSHAFAAAAVALFVLLWLRLDAAPSGRGWAALGIAAGLVALIYWVGAFVLLLPACTAARELVFALRQQGTARWRQLRALGAGTLGAAALALLVFSPQLLAWFILFGSPLTVPQGSGFISPRFFHGLDVLFSPLHGLLPWTPAMLVGMAGIALLARHGRWQFACLTTCMLIYLCYNASIPDWHGSGAFGMRRLSLLAPWIALGLALLYDWLRRWGALLPLGLAALTSAWMLLVVVRYDLYLLDHAPYSLMELPTLVFYLGRTSLPLEGIVAWLSSGYLWNRLVYSSTAGIIELAAVLVLAALGSWALLRQAG
ncbi:MAG: glycosyltransferase family 39 protein [Roseiflexaceae bacterium]|nr:glycosyltransferase family 39 protein [Roseiflexaceae bacterium]